MHRQKLLSGKEALVLLFGSEPVRVVQGIDWEKQIPEPIPRYVRRRAPAHLAPPLLDATHSAPEIHMLARRFSRVHAVHRLRQTVGLEL